jgi:hypothetical protein
MTSTANTRKLTILAQDPSVKLGGRIAFAQIDVPAEVLSSGPVGHRVKVIDFDASANVLYAPRTFGRTQVEQDLDPYAPDEKMTAAARKRWEERTLADPRFHAQHCYAVVMRTLARFEFALGRRVAWGFEGHQIHVAPHAFFEANAFYSEQDRALMFGYFKSARGDRPVFTCLSHDIVAHEATHAILDGLRDGFTNPSTPDQAAFHEGFSDVVALLSVFSLKEIVMAALLGKGKVPPKGKSIRLVNKSALTRKAIENSLLLGLGEQFGAELAGARADALRRSIKLKPRPDLLDLPEYQEEHNRGEVFAAAMMQTFLKMWLSRIAGLGTFGGDRYNLDMVVDEGAKAAENLLTMAIRALDYCPPVDLSFGDFLAAVLTADAEIVPDDSRFGYRALLRETFADYGVLATGGKIDPKTGQWASFDKGDLVTYSRTHFESMLHDKEEVFRFVWENREMLGLDDRCYTRIESVRPSVRQAPDGFFLKETICEYVQVLDLYAAEIKAVLGIDRPDGMPTTQRVTAYGGGTLVFDQHGRIKYHISKSFQDSDMQSARMQYLWDHDLLEKPRSARHRFANIHRSRLGAEGDA